MEAISAFWKVGLSSSAKDDVYQRSTKATSGFWKVFLSPSATDDVYQRRTKAISGFWKVGLSPSARDDAYSANSGCGILLSIKIRHNFLLGTKLTTD